MQEQFWLVVLFAKLLKLHGQVENGIKLCCGEIEFAQKVSFGEA